MRIALYVLGTELVAFELALRWHAPAPEEEYEVPEVAYGQSIQTERDTTPIEAMPGDQWEDDRAKRHQTIGFATEYPPGPRYI